MLAAVAILAVVGGIFTWGFASFDGFGVILAQAALPWLFVLQMVPVMIWLERKGSAWIQDRVGPERAFVPGIGLRLFGMIHNLADVAKLLTKEEFIPRHVNRFLYVVAPMIGITVALMIGAVIPFAHPLEVGGETVFRFQGLDIDIGILWLMAISSMGVYSVVLAGWASNNKFSQMGGLRASASMISYEITLGLALVGVLLVFGSTKLDEIVEMQSGAFLGFIPRWGIFMQPLGFILFLVAAFAETNRTPFDLVEADSEIVAGFHTEYGGFKFALFFMGEYISIVVQCLLMSTLFLGGWQILPWIDTHEVVSDPVTAATCLKILLALVVVGGGAIGWRLLKWHETNKERWKDARGREGALLAVLIGFLPAAAALIGLFAWGFRGDLNELGAGVVAAMLESGALITKTLLLCWLFVWVRWTVPRFRYDQVMGLGWKVLLPLGIANLVITGVLVQLKVF